LLVDGFSGLMVSGTEIINIPNGTTGVILVLGVKQEGSGDREGFDNFRVYE